MSTPRIQYRREYWVYPTTATEARRVEIATRAAKAQVTCGPSYDDAGIGQLTDKTAVLWDIPSDRHDEFRAWFQQHYPGTKVEFRADIPPPPPPPKPTGRAKLGLHASADGQDYREADFAEFATLQPTILKVMTNHPSESIRRLARQHAGASFVVRVYYSVGGRAITPGQFYHDTIADVRRVLSILDEFSLDTVVELHNEPNLTSEGLFMGPWTVTPGAKMAGWCSGEQFNEWYMALLANFRAALPGRRFIFPGLSPGATVQDVRINHELFAAGCKEAIRASNGLGIHTYWSGTEMAKGLSVVDWFAGKFPTVKLYVTEASNNQAWGTDAKAQQYVDFWRELQRRPTVQGVTYFVVSGNYPNETWVGKGMASAVVKARDKA